MVAEAVRTTRSSRRFKRRVDWHNPYLAAYVSPLENDRPQIDAPATPVKEAIERRYIERVVLQRLHQRPLREMALRHYDIACAYCGTEVLELLDTAHLVADSAGGEASVDNVRLLCANHHRAFDAGLLRWVDPVFVPAPSAPPLPPLPRQGQP